MNDFTWREMVKHGKVSIKTVILYRNPLKVASTNTLVSCAQFAQCSV